MTWGGMGGSGSRPSGGHRESPDGGSQRDGSQRGGGRPRGSGGGANAGWSIFSYMIAGIIAYGGIGWLVARWTGHPSIFPIGMLVGLVLAIVAIMYRYGRS
jgi:F0F1-type ATP synthase assembly protein I